MEQDFELNSSDASNESSSDSQNSSQSVSSEPKQSAEQQPKPDSDSTPFHEHPRFKELVEQKNKYADSYKQLENRYAEMEKQLRTLSERTKPQETQDQLIARLKGIDPEFGERFEKLDATQKELAELRSWRQQVEAEQTRTQAVNTVMTLHSQNKVPDDLQQLYNEQLEAMYARDPKNFVRDIQGAYKHVHERMSKLLDSVKRQERESYVSNKSQDAKVPTSQPKGKSVNHSKPEEYSKNPDEAKAQLVRRIIQQSKASNSI
jgi:hypothetical protein